ncbi:STAS domain-containing protein [Streptomyces minutiscleroticus]|uniref:STAS domain-containing protein n=1 Tax=Streptomyces minutiscleroticus TaxID=68238 RepID=UPI00167DE617|nr:STAS domain-containing protein [Streptomyces minutiscleroticus]
MTDHDGASEPSRLSALRTTTGTTVILSLEGEIDLHTARRLRQVLTADRDDLPARMVIDLKRVTFMDSSGLHALLDLHDATRDKPGWIRLSGIQPAVQRLIELSGLDAVFDCYPTVHHALTV